MGKGIDGPIDVKRPPSFGDDSNASVKTSKELRPYERRRGRHSRRREKKRNGTLKRKATPTNVAPTTAENPHLCSTVELLLSLPSLEVSSQQTLKVFFAGYRSLWSPEELLESVEHYVLQHYDHLDASAESLCGFFREWFEDGSAAEIKQALLDFSSLPYLPHFVSSTLKLLLLHEENTARKKNSCADQTYMLLRQSKPATLARAITLVEFQNLKSVSSEEIFNKASQTSTSTSSPIHELLRRSKLTSLWVSQCILDRTILEERAFILDYFIRLAQKLLGMNNFNGVFEILSGLTSPPIQRLAESWRVVKRRYKSWHTLKELKTLLSPHFNYQKYRQSVEQEMAKGVFVLPCVELLLQDIESKSHFNKEVGSKEYLELVLRVGMQCYNLQKLQSQEFSASVRQDIVFYVENALKPLCSEKELLQKSFCLEPLPVPKESPPRSDGSDGSNGSDGSSRSNSSSESRSLLLSSPVQPCSEAELLQTPNWKNTPIWRWTNEFVCTWLKDMSLSAYVTCFQSEAVDGGKLMRLTNDELIQMGVSALGHRKRIMLQTQKLIDRLDHPLDNLPMDLWTAAMVVDWLHFNSLNHLEDIFLQNNLNGLALVSLTDSRLLDIGVTALGHRKRILSLIQRACSPKSWSVARVSLWIKGLGLDPRYPKLFVQNHIDGEQLLQLTKVDLEKTIQIPLLGHRISLMKAIHELNTPHPSQQQTARALLNH